MSFIDHDFDFATDADFDAFITDAPVAAYFNHGDTFDTPVLNVFGDDATFDASIARDDAFDNVFDVYGSDRLYF